MGGVGFVGTVVLLLGVPLAELAGACVVLGESLGEVVLPLSEVGGGSVRRLLRYPFLHNRFMSSVRLAEFGLARRESLQLSLCGVEGGGEVGEGGGGGQEEGGRGGVGLQVVSAVGGHHVGGKLELWGLEHEELWVGGVGLGQHFFPPI